tara:strand:+ start:484 stop:1170 length:687 start_codon:yes stop_codon:yes gene_type:complete
MNNNNIKILFITEKLKNNFINVFIIYTSSCGLFIINLVGLVVIGYSVMIFNTCKIKFSAAIIHFFMNRFNYCLYLDRKFCRISPCPVFRTYLYIKSHHFFTSFLELIIFISYFIVHFLRPKFLIFGNDFGNDFGNESKPPQLIVRFTTSKLGRLLTFSGRVSVELSKPPQLIVRFRTFKFLNSGSDFGSDFGSKTFYKKDKISSWKAKMEWTTLRLKSNGLIEYLHNP